MADVKEIIKDYKQIEISIPRINQMVEDNPSIVDAEQLLQLTLKYYDERRIALFKPHYFEIIKILLPHSTYRINTRDSTLATFLLDQGKDFSYHGPDREIQRRVDSAVFHLPPELFFPSEPMHGNYVFIGHGNDTGTPIVVPPGCIYVVATLCGEISDPFVKFPKFINADKDALVQYAREGNTDALQDELKFPCTIYKEGDEVTEVMFDLPPIYHVMTHGQRAPSIVLPGGLMPIEAVRFTPVENTSMLVQYTYGSSVFPSPKIKQFVHAMNQTELSKYHIRVPLSELFKHYPGIHFMIICRDPPPGSEVPVKIRRAKSLDRYKSYTLETLRHMDEKTLQEVLKSPCYFIEEEGLQEFLSSKIDIHLLKGKIIKRGGMKQKIVCTTIKKSIRTGRKYKPWKTVTRRYCREKYRKMETLPTKRYFRDDQKRCFENHKGVDIHYTKNVVVGI
jgi:hypothetical protein